MSKASNSTKQFCFVATCTTTCYNTFTELQDMIDRSCSYQIVPSSCEVFRGQVWHIILKILPLSKNILLDLHLPFTIEKDKKITVHHARYLLLNQKVIGIRIRTGQNWPRYHAQKYRLPQQILRFYQGRKEKNEIINFEDKILIGQFYLSLNGIKIAPLFASEIQPNKQYILEEYERYGCDAYCLIDDIIYEEVGAISKAGKMLSQWTSKKKFPVLMAGQRLSYTGRDCYWSTPFIAQDSSKIQHRFSPFGSWNNIRMRVNVENCVKYRNWISINKRVEQYKEQDRIIEGVQARSDLIKFASSDDSKIVSDKFIEHKYDVNLKPTVLYLWFIFNVINKRNPFIVGVPFTELSFAMVNQLDNLRSYLKNLQIKDVRLLILYRNPPQEDDPKLTSFWPSNLQICSQSNFYENGSQMINKQGIKQFYFYNAIGQEKKYLMETPRPIHKKIYFCHTLIIDYLLGDVRIDKNFIKKVPTQQTFIRNLDKYCDEVLSGRHGTIEQMVKHFRRKYVNFEQMLECFTEIMPKKIANNLYLNPAHNLILNSQKDRMKAILSEIEARRNPAQQESKKQKKTQLMEAKIKQARTSKAKLKQSDTMCHLCKFVISKAYVIHCDQCRHDFCYECLGKRNVVVNKVQSQFVAQIKNHCYYCKKICGCFQCRSKRQREQQLEKLIKKRQSLKSILDDSEFPTCNNCRSLDIKNRKRISIECLSCAQYFCYNCLRFSQEIPRNNYKGQAFICKPCRQYQEAQIARKGQKQAQFFRDQQLFREAESLRRSILRIRQDNEIQKEMQEENLKLEERVRLLEDEKKKLEEHKKKLEEQKQRMLDENEEKKKNKSKKRSKSSSSSSSSSSSGSGSSKSRQRSRSKKISENRNKIQINIQRKQRKKQSYQQQRHRSKSNTYNINEDRSQKGDKSYQKYDNNRPNKNYRNDKSDRHNGSDRIDRNDANFTKKNYDNKRDNKDEYDNKNQASQSLWNANKQQKKANSSQKNQNSGSLLFQIQKQDPKNYEQIQY